MVIINHALETPVPLYAVYGPGRSGTTWLGAIINSHPQIAYRFEPFRRKDIIPHFNQFWESRNQSDSFSQADLKQIYEGLLLAHPVTDKPPFFEKDRTYGHGQKQLWHLARLFSPLAQLYSRLYTPSGLPPLVFKEVRWREIAILLRHFNLYTTFILRSPQGTVASLLRGQRTGLMPTWKRDNLELVLQKEGGDLAGNLPCPVATMSPVQKNAVLWRIEADRTYEAAQNHPNCLLVIYENLCQQPREVAHKVFAHFNIPWHSQVDDFITESTGGEKAIRKKEGAIKPYFSVSRNTSEVAKQWNRDLSNQEIQEIEEVVAASKAYRFLLEKQRQGERLAVR